MLLRKGLLVSMRPGLLLIRQIGQISQIGQIGQIIIS